MTKPPKATSEEFLQTTVNRMDDYPSRNRAFDFLFRIAHYSKLHDVQTLAMISCMFAADHGTKPGRNGHPWHPDMARSPSYNSIEVMCRKFAC